MLPQRCTTSAPDYRYLGSRNGAERAVGTEAKLAEGTKPAILSIALFGIRVVRVRVSGLVFGIRTVRVSELVQN